MSRDHAIDQQAQNETAGPEAAAENTHGLPPHLYGQVLRLGPGDAQALRDLLTLYPVFSKGILAVAAPHVGNAAVQRALAMVQQNTRGKPTEDAASSQALSQEILVDKPAPAQTASPNAATPWRVGQAEMHEFADEPAAAAKPQNAPQNASWRVGQAEMHEFADEPAAAAKPQNASWRVGQSEMHEFADEPAAAAKPQNAPWRVGQSEMHEFADEPAVATKSAAEPAWVAGARKYNAAHAELVSDFNDATGHSCLDASGQLDPQAVARWQRQHGVQADGKVGPHTLAAARQASAKAGPAAAAADQRIDV